MFDADPALYSRILTGTTLGFHIIFATLGVGVPLMILFAEWMGIRYKDPHYTLLARRWARGFVISVAIGVVTGTIIALQLSLLWPTFMQSAGQAIALPLFMETFAFFIEAIFLGIYLYTWDRFDNPIKHWLLMIPVAIGSSTSAIFITAANAFMNTPAGADFDEASGTFVNIEPWAAMFNPAMPTKISHVLATAYLTSAFVLAGIAAFQMLRGRRHIYYKKALKLTMTAALIFAVATALIGDLSGKFLADKQPEKLAAAEWHFETDTHVPLILGGILDENNEVKWGIKIPYALSILAHGVPGAEVQGLNETPEDERPTLLVPAHYLFDLMVGIGMFLALVSALFVFLSYYKKGKPYHKFILGLIVIGSPLSMLAIEFGWIFTEIARQPWIIVGHLRTADAATTSDHVGAMLLLFPLLYVLLGIGCIVSLRKLFHKYPAEQEIEDYDIQGRETL